MRASPHPTQPIVAARRSYGVTCQQGGSRKYSKWPLSQLLRSGRGEADPVPESGAATAPNRKSLKWNQRRRRRRPHHRAASSRCAAQAARAGRAGSAPPKASFAAPDSSAPTRQGIKSASAPAEKSGERARRRALSQLLRSGRGEADPVPESGAATAPNRKSLKWNRRRRRPHHRAASSRCAAQAARAGRADSAPPKASFAAPDSSAPTRQGIKSASAPAEKSGERARRRALSQLL